MRMIAKHAVSLIAAIGLHAGAVTSASTQEVAPWQAPIERQLQAFQSGNGPEAYSFAAPNIRQMFPTLETFMSMVQLGYPQVRNPKRWRMGEATPLSGNSVAQEMVLVGPDNQVWKALYTVELQPDGSWLIAAVVLEKLPAMDV